MIFALDRQLIGVLTSLPAWSGLKLHNPCCRLQLVEKLPCAFVIDAWVRPRSPSIWRLEIESILETAQSPAILGSRDSSSQSSLEL